MQPKIAEGRTKMEYGRIEREFRIDASPDVVYKVISSPAHIREWWHAEALLEPVSGAVGELVWGDKAKAEAEVASITVVDAEQPRLFSFRWVYPLGEVATPANSLLVTFELVPSGTGTVVRLTEVGFREMGWEAAVLEEQYKEHSVGWDTHFASLRDYLGQLVAAQ
ncbi:SRPBCC domain-containing protein [Cryobacterium glaciale]|nr:SRPBCC domain-containing protein [Cryobacterium glaciale]